MELIVQIIEGIFYIWLIKHYKSKQKSVNITVFRYLDWMLSTNIMLFTLMMYLSHLQYPSLSITDIYTKHKVTVDNVLILNFTMLYFGYLGEIGVITSSKAVSIGFIPFLAYYKLIYDTFLIPIDNINSLSTISKSDRKQSFVLFWYFFSFWSMYGFSALLPYTTKNICYNILDVFSKNFFGLFLSYQLYKKRTQI